MRPTKKINLFQTKALIMVHWAKERFTMIIYFYTYISKATQIFTFNCVISLQFCHCNLFMVKIQMKFSKKQKKVERN